MILTGKSLETTDMAYKSVSCNAPDVMRFAADKQLLLFITVIMALILTACGGGGGGGDGGGAGKAQCVLTEDQLDNLTPADVPSLPKACDGIGFFEIPSFAGLFILGTETDVDGNLKLYVHGVKQNDTPMTLADFEQATITVDGVPAIRPADWDVSPVADGTGLSMALLADYSLSITDADLAGMGSLYDVILNNAPAGFEGETVNFSSEPGASPTPTAITVKPDPFPYWTDILDDLRAANDTDPDQARNNTTLYDAMGVALMGPLNHRFDPFADNLGLVERAGPASLILAQTDGQDNASLLLDLVDIIALLDRCHTTAVMMGTFRSEVAAQVLDLLAGTRGIAVNALNTNFLRAGIPPYAQSLGNLAVITLSKDTVFADKTVRIVVDGLEANAVEPFDIDGSCQLL